MTIRYVGTLASALLFASCSSSPDSSTTPPGSATLSIANFDSWCSLSVTSPANTTLPNGASGATNTITVPVNTVVGLHAQPTSGFIWATTTSLGGGWGGALDTGTDPLSQSINVTLGASKSIKVCCPFPDGTGCPT